MTDMSLLMEMENWKKDFVIENSHGLIHQGFPTWSNTYQYLMEFSAQGNFFEATVFRQRGGKAPPSTQVLDSLQKRQNCI